MIKLWFEGLGFRVEKLPSTMAKLSLQPQHWNTIAKGHSPLPIHIYIYIYTYIYIRTYIYIYTHHRPT